MNSKTLFPKRPVVLTPEQKAINDDWQKYFFEINKNKFSSIIDFGHKYVANTLNFLFYIH